MSLLLIAATAKEIGPAIEWLKGRDDVEILITGIGIASTTYALTASLMKKKPDLVLQAGIGGSFSEDLPPGSLAFIGEDVIADLGAIEKGELIDVFDMGFVADDQHPYTSRMLVNPHQERYNFDLNFVRGATINCISSTSQQVSIIKKKYDPVIESMEGAALHYVSLMENIPFLQLRSVSNFTGERNKANWKIKEAVENLNDKLKEILSAYPKHYT